MTKIFLYVRGKDDIRGFLSAGHADWAEEGSDIVCAAVSALTQTCVNALETAFWQSDCRKTVWTTTRRYCYTVCFRVCAI